MASRLLADRRKGAGRALIKVMLRLTGRSWLPPNQVLERSIEDGFDLLRSWRYRTVSRPDGTLETVMNVRFEPSYVEAMMSDAGLALWLPNRPNVLIWALRQGRSPEIISADNEPQLIDAIRNYTNLYAMPVRFPDMDSLDNQAIANWRLPELRKASERYLADSLLVGTVNGIDGAGWNAIWRYYYRDESMQMTVSGDTVADCVRSALDTIRDFLARRQGISAQSVAPGIANLSVSGLSDFRSYVDALHYLRDVKLIRTVVPVQIEADTVLFEMDAGSDMATLVESISLDRRLRQLVDVQLEQSPSRVAGSIPSEADNPLPQSVRTLYYSWIGSQ